ncbi:hypothetical protein [Ferrimonas marina]|uniref:Uncharacterized protein n=1 Tax=Ferrimonas marina TaxID=299255 RepID=A0A1M5U9E9_9GAMM|nr:hypothetical protein [Ferrimonas marina]SHH59540.1 hypothetical protein SAMN02745129_2462 [Ferrimonas marina]
MLYVVDNPGSNFEENTVVAVNPKGLEPCNLITGLPEGLERDPAWTARNQCYNNVHNALQQLGPYCGEWGMAHVLIVADNTLCCGHAVLWHITENAFYDITPPADGMSAPEHVLLALTVTQMENIELATLARERFGAEDKISLPNFPDLAAVEPGSVEGPLALRLAKLHRSLMLNEGVLGRAKENAGSEPALVR